MPDYDPRIVDLYDGDNPDGPDHDFYRALAARLGVTSILDVGCGTGMLTVSLVQPGRHVVGVDPSPAMLSFARRRRGAGDVVWVDGDSSAAPAGPFDLVLMTGNVAQHIPDVAWSRTLADIRERMPAGALLSFETRNPAARAWEAWDDAGTTTRDTPHGPLEEWMSATTRDDRVVELVSHNRFLATGEVVSEVQHLVFRSRSEIGRDLAAAGLAVESVFADWISTPFDAGAAAPSPLMVVVARAR
ncbi:class I SAM-dependent methyltransferase [Microbacterium sp. cf332]|uniref:class I SAM-dependent methyltransferase n=1 Tax=Microbacterium sp. cf332 TaxID=1761804 RepID=UPI0008899508|nr:class I SAM-dependent methyltransferase [Microbacterium sp. cf332]SDQ21365.1 Methyltransferase domain-containing protein [Microbacterium sp. cf332]